MSAPARSRAWRAALERAREAADARCVAPAAAGPRTRRLAIGDAQAPLETFFEILDRFDLLAEDGWLRPEVLLVSMGDHFDYGGRAQRERAARGGVELIRWLGAHAADQVVLLAGNHDLARVGELASFGDRAFALAQADADRAYRDGEVDPRLQAQLLAEHPEVPSAELLARDFSSFRAQQREVVLELLQARRLRAAFAARPDLLLSHAGVTRDDLALLGIRRSPVSAAEAASALNAALDAALAGHRGGVALEIPGLHRPGSASRGEARGIFWQRPSHPGHEPRELFAGPPRRRFDPRTLPLGLIQGVGHSRDGKCRKLLAEWADARAEQDGPLRSLRVEGERVEYRSSLFALDRLEAQPHAAALLFLDGGMGHADPARYELLDLDALQPAVRAAAPR